MQIDSNSPSDLDIINRIINGKVNDFELLVDRYQEHILKIVKKHVPSDQIEETAQNVLVRVYKSLSNYEPVATFEQWISSIAMRTCYDCLKKVYRNREVPVSSLTEEQQYWLEAAISKQANQSFHEADARKRVGEILDWALNQLSPKERVVVELFYLEGLSVKEVSRLMGWSTANVKVRAFRSRKKLQKILMGK